MNYTQIIINEIGIKNTWKLYYVLTTDYDGLKCNLDYTQALNRFDNNNYEILDPDYYNQFINTLMNDEHNDINIIYDILDMINREVI